MKIKLFLSLILCQLFVAQKNRYNVYQIGKGEILKNDYYYLDYYCDDLLIAAPMPEKSITEKKDFDYRDLSTVGIINLNEEIKLPFQYRNIEKVRDVYELSKEKKPLLAILEANQKALFRLDGSEFKQLTEFKYWKFRPYLFDGEYLMAYNGFCQLYNLRNSSIIETDFIETEPLSKDLTAVKNIHYKWGILNKKGDTILADQFNDIRNLSESNGLIKVNKKDSIGVLNKNGEFILPPVFNQVNDSKTRIIAQAFNNGRKLIINDKLRSKLGNWTATVTKKNKTHLLINSIRNIKQMGLFGAFDFSGRLKIPFSYSLLEIGVNTDLVANKNNKYGIISENGKIIIDFKYDEITTALDSYYITLKDQKYGLYLGNKQVLEAKYDDVFPISKQSVLVLDNHIWNKLTLDKNGSIINKQKTNLSPEANFNYVEKSYRTYLTHLFGINIGYKHGVIDQDLNMVIPIVNPQKFKDYNPKYFDLGKIYSKKGIELIEFDFSRNYYDDNSKFTNTFICSKNSKYGVINQDGKTLIPFEYVYIQNIDGENFIVEKINN